MLILTSCGGNGPSPINLNKDNCDNCKMSISDIKFACEIVTKKGRAYKFDDLTCMVNFCKENSNKCNEAKYYANDFIAPNNLYECNILFFVKGENIASPMGGNIASFQNKDSANASANKWNAQTISWENIIK
ncbi:MAG: nitrous oxide reductase accessory protein NosL [Bacteroidetes bacterium]|nr:nitrous oxide reductase accessory protein NosL [Bacteroidota bacterium]